MRSVRAAPPLRLHRLQERPRHVHLPLRVPRREHKAAREVGAARGRLKNHAVPAKVHKPTRALSRRSMNGEFGSLEYVMDRYSKSWCWKVTGREAVGMISQLVPRSWYGEGSDVVMVPDNPENVGHLKWMSERHRLDILSKGAWQRRARRAAPRAPSLKLPKLREAEPGPQFLGELLGFQKKGLDFLIKSSGNALLADEMGLGKTVQTLAYLATEEKPFPALIVSPLVTLGNWRREIEKFLGRRRRGGRIDPDGSPSSEIIRTGRRSRLPRADVYITNYELVYKRAEDLSRVGLRTIVCDEVHNLRSKSTQKYRGVRHLSSLPSVMYRVGLSGTPIYNHGSEIWPIVNILRPGLLGNYREFCKYFCYINDRGKAIVLEKRRESLRGVLQQHVMLRRKKSDVSLELKDKIRHKEVIESDADYYATELGRIWRRLEEEQRAGGADFDKSASYQRAIAGERKAAAVAKMPHVIKFVRDIMEIEESVVVFCHHRTIHSLLHESLAEYSPVSVMGGQGDEERQRCLDDFQDGKSKLMIAGLRAGNVGINLTRAKYVVFAELDWSPAVHRQAEDRLHRIGQTGTVFAYYLIGSGTLDEQVAGVLVDKSYEIDSILDGGGEQYDQRDKARLILEHIHAGAQQ